MSSDLLKRSHAPLTSAAWKEIDETARRALRTHLIARKLVDLEGPKGWEFAAVGLGRLAVEQEDTKTGNVEYGIHRVQPLVEFRVRFDLDIWELDNISRGAKDVDLGPLIDAAQRAARFEDSAVLKGFDPGSIVGLEGSAEHQSMPLPLEATGFIDTLSKASLELQRASIEGPYALALGPAPYRFLASATATGYPLRRQVERLLEGPVLETDILEGGCLVSGRGGDFLLIVGQDLSIGYETHDAREVRLFVTESFTFRVLEPKAIVPFTVKT